MIDNLQLGLSVAFTIKNLAWCFLGTVIGTVVGVLPGLGPFAAISILLPITFYMDPISGIILLSGIYYGTQYGGSITSILLNLPGESSSVVTTLDGYQMARQGRAGAALSISAIGSFFAGCLATIIVAWLAVPLSTVAFKFGPAEYASLMVLGLIASAVLSTGSIVKAIGMVLIGILLGTVGIDINSGVERFTFGSPNLYNGISFVVIAMAVFGLSEVVYNILHPSKDSVLHTDVNSLYPTKEEMKSAIPAILRGTAIGSFLGVLPGAGAVMSSFASYAVEKKLAKDPSRFGKGAIEGVASPESANNAGAQVSFVPMLSLGLPTTPVMALMLAVLMIHNIQPGPNVISSNPELFWGLVVSMLIGNFFLIILNLPLVGLWVNILKVPKKILYPTIVAICITGAYYISNSWFNVWLLIPFTVLGYFLKRWDCNAAPLAMGLVVGEGLEEYMRRALIISEGSWTTFIDKPISLALLTASVIIIFLSLRTAKVARLKH